MQLDLPFSRAPRGPRRSRPELWPRPIVEPAPPAAPLIQNNPAGYDDVDFVRMRRARRYILRVRPGGRLRVTIPRGGSKAEAARFIARHAGWIERERTRVLATGVSAEWHEGAVVPLRGEPVVLQAIAGTVPASRVLRYGDRSVSVPDGAGDLRPYVEADLQLVARAELGARLRELARMHGLTVAGFTIRNQKSRWGSCSRDGRIALNFRLVQMPPDISDYVLIHELMHLKEQNHSLRFWRLVEAACPGFRSAERWLKVQGRSLF